VSARTLVVASRRGLRPDAAPPSRTICLGAAALVVGGVFGLIIHVLYGIGHGDTVVNENNEVLGLSSDTWSRVGGVGTTLLIAGLLVLRRVDPTRLMLRGSGILLVGLSLRIVADWVFDLYVPAELLLLAGRAVLVGALATGTVLSRRSAWPMASAVAAWALFAAATDAVYGADFKAGSITVAGNDVLAFLTALAWVCLGAALYESTKAHDVIREADRSGWSTRWWSRVDTSTRRRS
jgi:hypothetical protein